ncbi:probable serine/threonine-protein kinase pats1 isoform X2 [Mercenaria mercenaria]|nr:probable serine/threonine-protein kinase pats1 isoform X2 [Mercenaria mercenaria]XP_053375130.1 probable serine/threonine-protein kinase pats1 isoform X2 [Mercenaria mercenaria]
MRLRSNGPLLYTETKSKSEDGQNAFTIEQMFQDEETSTEYDIWDFGGQYVFYATHALFHSNRAIYLLVMNLTKDLGQVAQDAKCPNETGDRNVEYFLRFWMNSIHSFAGSLDGFEPPVILVGTHMDKVRGLRKRTKLKRAENYFENVRRLFDGTQIINHIYKKDFAVDNHRRNDAAIDLLREEIMSIGKSRARAIEIPTRWIGLESKLKNSTQKVVTLDEIQDFDIKKGSTTMPVAELKLFLQYQHAKGRLFYFDREPIADYVVLDPQYLIDAFKCIMTSERFCRKDPQIRPLWKKLSVEGKLEMKLIDSLWSTEEGFINHKTVLLGYLQQHHIISEAMQYDENVEKAQGLGWFVVPSLLKHQSAQSKMNEYVTGKVLVKVRFLMRFEYSSVLSLLFHRLVAATLGRWSIANYDRDNLMYENLFGFRLNIDHDGVIQVNDNLIELTVLNLCPGGKVEGSVADTFRRFVENVVSREFAALKGSIEEKNAIYTPCYRCNHISHGLNGSKQIQEISQLPKNKNAPCPDSMPHEIDTLTARSEWFQEDKLPSDIPNKDITDKEFSRFAQAIGKNWQFLGLELGLTSVQIDHVIEDNPHSVAMQIYKMLIQWRLQVQDEAKMDIFVKILQTCSNVNVEWDEIRNIVDDVKRELEKSDICS